MKQLTMWTRRLQEIMTSPLREAPACVRVIASGAVLLWVLALVYVLAYYRDPMGDDVLYQMVHGYLYYLDGNTLPHGGQIHSVGTWMENLWGVYTHNGGRLMGFTLIPLLSLLGQGFTAVVTALLFALVLLAFQALLFKDAREPFRHPFLLLITFLVFFYLNGSNGFLLMWTFTSIYIVSALMMIVYYSLYERFIRDEIPSPRMFLGFSVFGFFAGLTHEVFSFSVLSFLVLASVRQSRKAGVSIWPKIRQHAGLAIGTFISVSAPGNFVRLSNTHDAVHAKLSYVTRLNKVVLKNFDVLLGHRGASMRLILLVLAIFLVGIFWNYRGDAIELVKQKAKKRSGEFLFLVYLTFFWALFPYVGAWGTLLFLIAYAFTVFRIFYEEPDASWNWYSIFERSYLGAILPLIVVAVFVRHERAWLVDFVKTTQTRRALVTAAKAAGQTSVVVPRYDGRSSNRFTMDNYNNFDNDPTGPACDYYVAYFGIAQSVPPPAGGQ